MHSSMLAGRQRAFHAHHAVVQKGADLAAHVPNSIARSGPASEGENSRQPMNDVPFWKLPPPPSIHCSHDQRCALPWGTDADESQRLETVGHLSRQAGNGDTAARQHQGQR